MNPPIPTPIYRFMHVDNLTVCLRRRALHAPRHVPDDGENYRTIHNVDIQRERSVRSIPCGPGGVIHDYVSFYFGPLSPMLLQLHTNRVPGYSEGQEPLLYLVSSAQTVVQTGCGFVFSDGHGIASYTTWFSELSRLVDVDWSTVNLRYWKCTVEDMDRQRRKQAEFLVHERCDWSLVREIGVLSSTMKERVEAVLAGFDADLHRPVRVRRDWYY